MHNLLVPHNIYPIQQNPAGPPNEHTHTSAVTQQPTPPPNKTDETDTWTAVPEKEKKREKEKDAAECGEVASKKSQTDRECSPLRPLWPHNLLLPYPPFLTLFVF